MPLGGEVANPPCGVETLLLFCQWVPPTHVANPPCGVETQGGKTEAWFRIQVANPPCGVETYLPSSLVFL